MDRTAVLPKAEDIKIIMTDVDGTFLTDTHTVHPRTRDAVKFLRETHPDVPIIVTTGKHRNSCEWFIKELGMDDCPAAACHGSIIHAPGGRILDAVGLDSVTALKILEECRRLNKSCFLFTSESVVLVNEEENPATVWTTLAKQFDANLSDGRSNGFLNDVRLGKVKIIKATIAMDAAEVPATSAALRSVLSENIVHLTQALPFVLEVVPAGINKSVALQRFCRVHPEP